MLEKPDLQDDKIHSCLQDEYGLSVVQLTFLPLGADQNTAVYRAVAEDNTPYFVKLRQGIFDKTAVMLPRFLSDRGIEQVIAPLETKTGQLWADLEAFKLILYPFIDGGNAYEVGLSDRHWTDLGKAMRRIHNTVVPLALEKGIQKETFSSHWREAVKMFLEQAGVEVYDDPVAKELAAFMQVKHHEISDLVERAEHLAGVLKTQSLEYVLCHSDLHAYNILIAENGALYIIDWDNPTLAPVERDLMFIGGAQFGARRTACEEETLFYRGYGQTRIDPKTLAYYRYERIVQDIAEFSKQLLFSTEGGKDREQSFSYLKSNFLPGNTIENAYQSDNTRS